MYRYVRWFIIFCLLSCANSQAQNFRRVSLETGAIGRVTIFYLSGLKGKSFGPSLNADAPYGYKSGVNGTGLNISASIKTLERYGLFIVLGTNVRYDFLYYNFACNCNRNTIYVDPIFAMNKYIYKQLYVGGGVTIFNLGRELNYTSAGEEKTLQLQFTSIDIAIGIPVWKIFVEPKISIVQKNFPGTTKDNATLFGARVFYRINFRKH